MDEFPPERIIELSAKFARDIDHCRRYNKPGGLRAIEAGWAQFRTSLTSEGRELAWRTFRKVSGGGMTPGLETPEQRRRFTIRLVSEKMAYMFTIYEGWEQEAVWKKEWDDYRNQLTGEDLSIADKAFEDRKNYLQHLWGLE